MKDQENVKLTAARALRVVMAKKGVNGVLLAKILKTNRQQISTWRTQGTSSLISLQRIANGLDYEAGDFLKQGDRTRKNDSLAG